MAGIKRVLEARAKKFTVKTQHPPPQGKGRDPEEVRRGVKTRKPWTKSYRRPGRESALLWSQ